MRTFDLLNSAHRDPSRTWTQFAELVKDIERVSVLVVNTAYRTGVVPFNFDSIKVNYLFTGSIMLAG
jgi:hypothetical protein